MALKIHHLNCGTMCPHGAPLINGYGKLTDNGHMVCHCLLIESNDGLVLVDTGLGIEDTLGNASTRKLAVCPVFNLPKSASEKLALICTSLNLGQF